MTIIALRGKTMKKVYKTISMPREQVYEDVWNAPLTALAKKYSLNYSLLSETLRRNNIPYPGPGFWTKKRFNKINALRSKAADSFLSSLEKVAVENGEKSEECKKKKPLTRLFLFRRRRRGSNPRQR